MAEKITADVGGCRAKVMSALPRASKDTLDAITDAMEVHLKYLDKDDPQRALELAVEQVSQKMRRNLAAQKFQKYLNIVKRTENWNYIKENFPNRTFEGLQAKMVGINSDVMGSRLSAMTRQEDLEELYLAGIESDLEQAGILKQLAQHDEVFDRQVAIEMERTGQEHILPDTEDPLAKQAASILLKWQEKMRIDANDAGAAIGKLRGRITTQTHDMFRIRSMGRDAWINLINEKLDWKRIELEGGKLIPNHKEHLSEVYDSIISGVYEIHHDALPSSAISGSIAKRMSHERVLHFKPGEWFDYNLQAGSRHLLDSVIAAAMKSSRSTGLMQAWGPSAIHNMEKMAKDLRKKYPEQAEKFSLNRFDADLKGLTGEVNIPDNHAKASFYAAIKTWQNWNKLGGGIVATVFGDPITAASEMRWQGIGTGEGYKASLTGSLKGLTGTTNKAAARALGVVATSRMASLHGRIDPGGGMNMGRWSKLNQLLFRLNGMGAATAGERVNLAHGMASFAAGVKDLSFDKLNPKYQRVLSLYEISPSDWDLMRKHGVESVDEGEVQFELMTREAIERIPDDAIRSIKGDDLTPFQVKKTRGELAQKFHAYVVDRTNIGILRPDVSTGKYLHGNLKAGTHPRGLVDLVMQFKGFPIAFIQKVIGREIYGSGATSLREAVTQPDVLMGMGKIIAESVLWGYAILATKDIINNKKPPSLFDEGVWREAALKGGGFGFYGDILFGELRQTWGKGAIDALAGPSASTLGDMLDLAGRARDGELDALRAVKTIYRNTSTNLFYVKAALDYAVLYNLMEIADPGSVARMERRFKSSDREHIFTPLSEYR